jgi:hypothetical protein
MNSEERFDRIERDMAGISVLLDRTVDVLAHVAESLDRAQGRQDRFEAQQEEARRNHEADIAEIREIQKSTDCRLNALNGVVDRIV